MKHVTIQSKEIKILPEKLSCKRCGFEIDNPGRLPDGWSFVEIKLRGHPDMVCDNCVDAMIADDLAAAALDLMIDLQPERIEFGSEQASRFAALQHPQEFYNDALRGANVRVELVEVAGEAVEIISGENVIHINIFDLPALIEILRYHCPEYDEIHDLV